MLKLFQYKDNEVVIEPEALLLEPFKKIVSKNKRNKNKAITELAFIYFFSDPRSDYQYIIDKSSRVTAIKQGLGLENSWKPDEDINKAIEFYESFKSEAALLLEDTRAVIEKLRTALREIDFTQVDDKGKPIFPLNTITSTIKAIPSLAKDLNEAEKALNKEIASDSKMRGGQEKTIFEDGIVL